MKLFVGGIPFRADESSLKEAFQSYGEVSSAKIITDKFTGRSRGFAFVEMPSEEQGNKAMLELNNKEIGGRSLSVSVAREKSDNQSSYSRKQDKRRW